MMWLGIYGDETVGGEAIGLVVGRYDFMVRPDASSGN
jgi:hypothetical protein